MEDIHDFPALTPAEAKAEFDATHYKAMVDGVTPQMYYKHDPVKDTIQYLSYCHLWQGSEMNFRKGVEFDRFFNSLVEI